jgi:hypothetical protein
MSTAPMIGSRRPGGALRSSGLGFVLFLQLSLGRFNRRRNPHEHQGATSRTPTHYYGAPHFAASRRPLEKPQPLLVSTSPTALRSMPKRGPDGRGSVFVLGNRNPCRPKRAGGKPRLAFSGSRPKTPVTSVPELGAGWAYPTTTTAEEEPGVLDLTASCIPVIHPGLR